jgi:membrane protease YdiL (CAAX protease family)
VVALIWVAGSSAGLVYAHMERIPLHVALPVMPAFLLELTAYLFLGVEEWRACLDKVSPAVVASMLALGAPVPYVIASLAAGSFDWNALAWIVVLAAAESFWYVALPHKIPTDLLFLLFVGVVWVSRTLRNEYVSPQYPKLQLDALAHLMWVRTGTMAMLSVRRMSGVGFGFWPEAREWKIGVSYFAVFAALAGPLAWWLGFASPRWPLALGAVAGWGRISVLVVVTFFGSLWVLALSEEFLFRGLLQQWMASWLNSQWGGLLAAAMVFGTVHLWMRPFPNWRNAILAGILGVLCGLAFRQARSIRASMVTHALTITIWRIFFVYPR